MLRHGSQGRLCGKVRAVRIALVKGDGESARDLLSPERVQRAVEAEGVSFRESLYTPLVTLWTFLAQVLDPNGSCRTAVAKLLAFLAGMQKGGHPTLLTNAEGGHPTLLT